MWKLPLVMMQRVLHAGELAVAWMQNELRDKETKEEVLNYVNQVTF
jgi:hypothetical protein